MTVNYKFEVWLSSQSCGHVHRALDDTLQPTLIYLYLGKPSQRFNFCNNAKLENECAPMLHLFYWCNCGWRPPWPAKLQAGAAHCSY